MKKLTLFCISLICFLNIQHPYAQTCSTDSIELQSQTQMLFSVPIGIVADRMNRPFCYVAGKEGGLSIYNTSNIQSPQLVLNLPPAFFDSLHIMYLVQDSIYLYVALGNFFGTNPQEPGLAILNIDTPSNPQLMDLWKWNTVTKGASTVLIEGQYAYLSAMTEGVFILNISNKNSIQFESNFIPDPNWPVVNPNPVQEPNARGMAYRNDTLFLCYDAGGLRVLDVTNKTGPFEIAKYLNSGSAGKQEAFNHIILDGNLAYISEDYCGMEVLNISNVNNITQVGWWNPWNCELPGSQWNGCPGHTNQMVFNPTLKIVYLSAGDSELRMVDVSNPAQPDSCNGYGPVGDSKACWGTDVFGPYLYLTYINSFIPYFSNWSGFKALSWSQISGISDVNINNNNLVIYPNPSRDFITIQNLNNENAKAEINIFSVTGSLLMQKVIKENNTIDISDLSSGIYILAINKASMPLYQKFVKY